jgi:hypothetical protein
MTPTYNYNIFSLTYHSDYYSINSMKPQQFFLNPNSPAQKHYEALRAFYVDSLSVQEISQRFQYSTAYFKKLQHEFKQHLKSGGIPFFLIKKSGPKTPFTKQAVIEQIVALRKQNLSIQEIRMLLLSQGHQLSLDTIDRILKVEGFAPLPRRTKREKHLARTPPTLTCPQCTPLKWNDETFYTERGAGPLIFLPLIEELHIVPAIRQAGFPSTTTLSDVSSVMSFLALKLAGYSRYSHTETWSLDRAMGLFATLNVLPKSATLSSYSYRVTRSVNRRFLKRLSSIFHEPDASEAGEFNLDFKTIPHWGDDSVLEKHWSGTHTKALKSVLALIVEEPATGYLSYSNAEISHDSQQDAVIDFVDFWKTDGGIAPKMLIFDSKFTTYQNLNKLNQSKEPIKFLTLRRRGKKLVKYADDIPKEQWQSVRIEGKNRKYTTIKVHDETTTLRHYSGPVRQLILTDHGRQYPTFMITNDFESPVKTLVKKYARRWLVELEIAEHIAFFHLNHLSSSIVVKVDFDLTVSLLAHNLYQKLSAYLPGFERCSVPTIYRKFIENGAKITIQERTVMVALKKKTHLPILFELPWMKTETFLSSMNCK